MKPSIILLSCLMQLSCRAIQIPISKQSPKSNKTYEIEYLFDHDGCKVYRFKDGGHYVYFTSCKGETTSVLSDSTGTHYIKSQNSKN